MLKRIFTPLLPRVIAGIILGVICGLFFPEGLARVFTTFNGLFSNFLGFIIPVLILALVAPAIADLGRGAGKWLLITAGIAYASTIIAGLLAYGTATALFPTLLGERNLSSFADPSEHFLTPFFEVAMPAPMDIMTALLLAFCIGVGITLIKGDTLHRGLEELRKIIMKTVISVIIPLLPIYIFGAFLSLTMNGQIGTVINTFIRVVIVAFALTVLYLVLQYSVAGAIAGRNPFKLLRNMLPAYFTALGTSSSAATIPVTLQCTLKNGVREDVAGFTVPLCATIHLAGSTLKIVLFSVAVMMFMGRDIDPGTYIGFIFMLGITMVAAPGVPGGAIMAAVGLLGSMLGFDDTMISIMIATYVAIDSFGTACNVTGDGAIAVAINKFFGDREQKLEPATEPAPAAS
ncbi:MULTISPECIES: dicarboxylate/amino acid:cation symporter [Kocuria]|uniref:Dicarboxylate/amino acid:cation symporter n=1 Tax=Kocuria subflava TaxID=1736139 RepID=A0A846TTK6_9MICC|nr:MULTISPECIES: dicarboxylate/amino acid:cation symporter [Kocuria]NKE10330.1 dicarboxylate/amino acid:cation symporter [Kocuria subflava]